MGKQRGMRPRVAICIGTRPEAIKVAPVLRALRARGTACALVCTGQHPDLDLAACGVTGPAGAMLGLDARGLSTDAMCEAIERLAYRWLAETRPELVLVQGDTNSALAAARAAERCGISIGHVEAGLRTFDFDDPWPEERNRVEIDRISALLFAPTETACRNLEREGVGGRIILCGNSGIDALLRTANESDRRPPDGARVMLLVTMHRRENRGLGVVALMEALKQIAALERVEIVMVLHPNAHARRETIDASAKVGGLTLVEPQSYAAMVGLMLRSHIILTDSGGLQEEAPALGRPLLILRASTERPEAIASGNAQLVGTSPERIVAETMRLLDDPAAHARMSVPSFPFGTGGAAPKIADALEQFIDRRIGAIGGALDRASGAA